MVKYSFWEKVNEAHTDVIPPFEHVDEDVDKNVVYIYQTLLKDHPDREGTAIDHWSILRMRFERVEVP